MSHELWSLSQVMSHKFKVWVESWVMNLEFWFKLWVLSFELIHFQSPVLLPYLTPHILTPSVYYLVPVRSPLHSTGTNFIDIRKNDGDKVHQREWRWWRSSERMTMMKVIRENDGNEGHYREWRWWRFIVLSASWTRYFLPALPGHFGRVLVGCVSS